jgi:hypothetical protein
MIDSKISFTLINSANDLKVSIKTLEDYSLLFQRAGI